MNIYPYSIRYLTTSVVIWMALCSAVYAQQRLAGTVSDHGAHHPIGSAVIKLESDLLTSARTVTTDSAGQFSFAGLSPGRYTVSVTVDRFYPEQITVVLAPRATQQVVFELTPVASVQEQVVIHAQPKLMDETEAATTTTISRDQISALPAGRRTQLADIVTPFVASAVGSHDNLVHLRGNELSLNTFINGVSFFDNPHQLFTPGMAPDVIQAVNVITGGFPAEFGNRFGGILDIVTRSGFDAKDHGSVTLTGGSFRRHNVALDYGGHTQRFGYFFYAQSFENGRFLNTPEPSLLHDFGKGSRTFAQFDYRLDARNSLKLLLTGDGTNFELPNTADDEARGRDFFQRNREQTAVLSWEHTFSASAILSTSVYERVASARLIPTTDPFSIQAGGLRNDLTAGVKSDLSLYAGQRHTIKTGIDLMTLSLREDFFFDGRENETEIAPFTFRGRRTGGEGSLYLQDQVRVFRNLTANLGVRFDQYNLVTSGHALSPRINLAYALPDKTVLHFAYNRFFSPPPIENLLLSARLGEEGVPPQIARSHHLEAGVRRSIHDRMVVRMTGFWRSDRNSFETTELANVRIFAPTTFARGKAYGIEFSSQLAEIKPLGLSGYFNYTAQRVFQTGPVSGGFTVEEVGAGERGPAAFDQVHTAVAGMTWREHHGGFWAGAALEYGSGTPASFHSEEGPEVRVRLPQHTVANFYFGVNIFGAERRRVSLQLNVENATNRVYRIAKESEFTPVQFSSPRFISGSLRFHF